MLRRARDGAGAGGERQADQDAVLALGIDRLPFLEELFGEAAGAEILAETTRRLRLVLPQDGVLTATGHSRLVIVLPRACPASVASLFDELQAAVTAEPVETGQGPVAVSVSAGCAFVAGGADADTLRSIAFIALHAAMARGAGHLELARDDRELVQCRARLTDASRAALGMSGESALTLAFQPVVRASGGISISFHECLVRLRRPEGHLLPAGAFMPDVERLGLSALVDRQALEMTLATLARHPNARLSLNVSAQTMHDRQWMASFEEGLARDATLADRLIIELTEGCSMIDLARTRDFMTRLREHGVCFAIDDFGAKHGALNHLRDLRFDILKIDERFVRDIRPGSDQAFIIETLVGISRRFDMMTVAEAVQAPIEARCLAELGIEHFQGFYFGSPSLMLGPTPSPMPAVAAQA
jgi:EAL domain-containing protein (putative c-di-GMP-specific phosphodiesterase class I)